METLDALIRLLDRMRQPQSLEPLMQLIADATSEILGVSRVSIRLVDPSRTTLMAIARAGQPLHDRAVEFRPGEGLIGWIVEHGQVLRIANSDGDPRFVARPGMSGPMGAFLGAPIRAGLECTGVISAVDAAPFDERQEKLLVLIAAACTPYLEIARLSRVSRADPLTGALNRRGLDEIFPEVHAGVDGALVPLSVAMIDIDHFKRINDTHGHAAGDLVLRHLAGVIATILRAADAVIRIGGEEFLLILAETDRAQAVRIAERVRCAVIAAPALVGDQTIAVTISMGVAERHAGEQRDAVIARADAALYEAKRRGRDRIEIAD